MRKIISFMRILIDVFMAGSDGEMDWIKVDEEILTMPISEGDTALYLVPDRK